MSCTNLYPSPRLTLSLFSKNAVAATPLPARRQTVSHFHDADAICAYKCQDINGSNPRGRWLRKLIQILAAFPNLILGDCYVNIVGWTEVFLEMVRIGWMTTVKTVLVTLKWNKSLRYSFDLFWKTILIRIESKLLENTIVDSILKGTVQI